MSGAFAALLLTYGALWPLVTGYVMQVVSVCEFSDDKQGNITYQYLFTFNRQWVVLYDGGTDKVYPCNNCIQQVWDIAHQVAQQLEADKNWMNYFKREGVRCKEEVGSFWDKTVDRKAKPSVEFFEPVQVHPESLPILMCHVWGFYPQEISVTLFKNDIMVKNYTAGVRSGDWTYNVRATLDLRNFHPDDNYTCLVNHPSLDRAIVMQWKHGLTSEQIIKISVASVVFALGLIWLIAGVVLWRNAKRSGYIPILGSNGDD